MLGKIVGKEAWVDDDKINERIMGESKKNGT
jgi:hypothetical protein